jgi:hypothetical protein
VAVGDTGAGVSKKKKKFQNGWTHEIEQIMAEWADKAVCYRWMHEKTERKYHRKDMAFMFPVIILSTITGAANFAMDSVLDTPDQKRYAQLFLGGLSIATGIISTIANRLGYASGSEAHKGAAILWGKFQRLIAIELSLHPDERNDCMGFLKACRSELDRLIEQSPTIPDYIIQECKKEFASYPKVRKPEIVGDINTTHIFVDKGPRIKAMAREAALAIAQKKGLLKQIVLDDLEPRISNVLQTSTIPALREELKHEVQLAAEKATRQAVVAVAESRVRPSTATGSNITVSAVASQPTSDVDIRSDEVRKISAKGLVREMRAKLMKSDFVVGRAPVGIGAVLPKPVSSVYDMNEDDVVVTINSDVTQKSEIQLTEIPAGSLSADQPPSSPSDQPNTVATQPADGRSENPPPVQPDVPAPATVAAEVPHNGPGAQPLMETSESDSRPTTETPETNT